MSAQLAFALWLLCLGVACVLLCACIYGAQAWNDYCERQKTLKRDLGNALARVEQLTLELAMARVAMNMRATALSVRPRVRSLHLVVTK